ncbi:MAG: hypothetical protein L6Q57_07385 [Alphaproteobacteria bacterium]|nr:hypothetical protein [Alphaproteobacteria bacterium]
MTQDVAKEAQAFIERNNIPCFVEVSSNSIVFRPRTLSDSLKLALALKEMHADAQAKCVRRCLSAARLGYN